MNNEIGVSFTKVFLEHLPNVLILQLKRFIYDKDGGLQKVMKKVNFPIDLEITKGNLNVNMMFEKYILYCNIERLATVI